MTALEMPGCSLSILAVDDARLRRLDAPATAPAWPGNGRIGERRTIYPLQPMWLDMLRSRRRRRLSGPLFIVRRWQLRTLSSVRKRMLTELDSKVGDGDLGISMVRGAAAIRALPEEAWREPKVRLPQWLRRCAGRSPEAQGRSTRRHCCGLRARLDRSV